MGAKRTAQRLNKLMKSMNPGKERYQKAAMVPIFGREMQCMFMQYYAIGLYEPNEFVEMSDDADLKQMLQKNIQLSKPEKYVQIYFDVELVKAALDDYKANKPKGSRKPCVIELNGKAYNAEFVLDALNVLTETDGLFGWCQTRNWNSIDYIESEDGIAIICPYHVEANGNAVHIPVEIIDKVK